jgi:Uncharacterised nucleotidyltransferase
VLTHYLYGDSALRQYGDLDVLLTQDELFRASEALTVLDYAPKTAVARSNQRAFLSAARQYDLEMVHRERGDLLELHWRADADHFVEQLDSARWWSGLQSVMVGDRVYRQLSDRELCFTLLVHGMKHQWSRLAWLLDIALLVAKLDIDDMQWLMATASAKKCFVRLQVGLVLADKLFGTNKRLDANETSHHLQPRVQRIVMRIERELRSAEASETRGLWRSVQADLECNDTLAQSARKFIRLVFTPNHDDWHDLPTHPLSKLMAFGARIARLLMRQTRLKKNH